VPVANPAVHVAVGVLPIRLGCELGLSRWTRRRSSYRTLYRFYQSPVNWAQVHWALIYIHLLGAVLLVGDKVTVSKAGKQPYGVGRFYSGPAQ